MFNWVGKLFGTKKAISDLTDKDSGLLVKAGSWIGNFNYTDEEKSESNHKTQEWGLKQLSALEPFKVVQRIIAFGVIFMWVIVGLNVLLALWIEALNPAIDIQTTMMEFAMSDYIFWPVVSVLSLYMSGGVLPQLLGKNKSK